MKLTPNRRMAVFLERASAKDTVLPLNNWLEQLYIEWVALDPSLPSLLSDKEENILWEKIIGRSLAGQSLLKTTGAARLASDALTLCYQWQLKSFKENAHSSDIEAFIEWMQEYQSICQQRHWIGFSKCVDLLTQGVSDGLVLLPADIQLFGFEELSPQLNSFFKAATFAGTTVRTQTLVSFNSKRVILAAETVDEEFRLAAHQAKHWLQKNPQCSIGIVVPDLEQKRLEVQRIFEENWLKAEFNIAAPLPLGQHPVIEAALLGLSFLEGKLPLEKFSQYLRSPFFGMATSEKISRIALDVTLRKLNEAEFTIEQLLFRIEREIIEGKATANPALLASLQNFLAKRPSIWLKQSAQNWCLTLTESLDSLGWPGERALNSDETKIREQWDELLVDYISMDRVLGEHTWSEALSRITRLANDTPFTPFSNKPSVQILGLLEASGIPFDYLWVTGMHREAWPPEPSPNPFIPLSIQWSENLPRGSATRELKMAKQFIEQLSKSAPHVVFSYPKTIDDQTCTMSALLESVSLVTKESLGLSDVKSYLQTYIEKTSHYKAMTSAVVAASDVAPPLGPLEKVFGGTQLLKLQAACPFRAFAEVRLRAQPLPVIRLGLNQAERGEIVHEILQCFWQGLNNQDDLKALLPDEITERITNSIETVLKKWQRRRPSTLTPQYVILEKKRLKGLISRFIELEKTRSYFEVLAHEEENIVALADVQIKIRIDRIDCLADGSEILIDYKTGETSIRDWFGDRPFDPQLPLYCATRTPNPVGIVFGTVRPEAVKYHGLTKDAESLPGVKTLSKVNIDGSEETWEAQCGSWQSVLESLAKDFSNGVATVDPVNGASTCRFCSLQSVCRIKEKGSELELGKVL